MRFSGSRPSHWSCFGPSQRVGGGDEFRVQPQIGRHIGHRLGHRRVGRVEDHHELAPLRIQTGAVIWYSGTPMRLPFSCAGSRMPLLVETKMHECRK